MRKTRTLAPGDETYILAAIAYLRQARDWLKTAGADKAADYTRRALKSAEGAQRHAQGLRAREERKA